jgi:hypothetical protein
VDGASRPLRHLSAFAVKKAVSFQNVLRSF